MSDGQYVEVVAAEDIPANTLVYIGRVDWRLYLRDTHPRSIWTPMRGWVDHALKRGESVRLDAKTYTPL
jgi:hypothetical protein